MNTFTARQRRLDDLLENLPAGVIMHGPDGYVLSANRVAHELLAREDVQLIGKSAEAPIWGFLRADQTKMAGDEYPVNVVLRTHNKVKDVLVGVPADTSERVRWLICNAYPEFDAVGTLVDVVVCFTDCTALDVVRRRLEKSEERLSLILQGSTDAPWDWDVAAGEIYYSDRWWNMLGYTPGELPADPALWANLAHPEDKPALDDLMRKLFAAPETMYSIELRLCHRDGHYVPMLSRGLILRDQDGRPLRISGTNSDLTERKAAERRIYRLVNFDQLTGLPNRRYLVEMLEKIRAGDERSGRFSAVFALNLDNFKLVNDTMGRDNGDDLLRQVAGRLRQVVNCNAQLARMGSDEFVVALDDVGRSPAQAVAETSLAAREILVALGKPYVLAGQPFVTSSSVGVAICDGMAADAETMLKQANLAMRRAKAEGRDMARFYDPSMQDAADRQAALERVLHDEVSLRQFVLFCQPQFSAGGDLTGAEVLVRWRRDDKVLVAPDKFIPLAESSGLIVALGRHVLAESCHALARWRHDAVLGNIKLGVNVSVQQLREPSFPDTVAAILELSGAPPARLCLELTESVFAGDMSALNESMQKIRALGVTFSLDDFGTGYSSLAYLRRFPLASLKIDRSFVQDVHLDPDAAPIVVTIIALARTLELDVVAEGVEHEAQRKFLVEQGCSTLQGFLLGMPVPIEEFEQSHRAGMRLP